MSTSEEVPPTPDLHSRAMARAAVIVEPVRRLISPKFYGVENVPAGGALLVGNHALYGILDVVLLYVELHGRGIWPRSLVDHAVPKQPGVRNVINFAGAVPGTRANTRELMRRGDLIMVFPGGGRELTKRKGERYQLIWKNRLGFAMLAIEHGYPIIPFASVGTEHALDIVMDADSPLMAPARHFFKNVLGSPDTPPIVRGIGLTPIPRPERLYYWFGEPIPTTMYNGVANEANARELRSCAANAIEGGIEFLLDQRDHDPGRSLTNRLLRRGRD